MFFRGDVFQVFVVEYVAVIDGRVVVVSSLILYYSSWRRNVS